MFQDDDLALFAERGAAPLPAPDLELSIDNDGARLWCASFGSGPTVFLLHGGLGNSGNFGYQVPALVAAGYRVVTLDSRGHGRSSRDDRPYSYVQMAADVIAVMDRLGLDRAAFIGWSDGACTALVLADAHPERVAGIYFFACNVDPTGTRELVFDDKLGHCIARHRADYAALSATPDAFDSFSEAVGLMQRTQPDYSAADLGRIAVPVWSVLGEHDEFIRAEHARHIANAIPGARFLLLPGVSHFAPLQRPDAFNATLLDFLAAVAPPPA